ncbi:hypothetical protein DOTSEDRAFT_70793 [Dothistroma septosporum NZE10]|uniref:Zn(2)-C6 fungal-type domain-containing protein n=1 Tax=Dothistroma septosporum (strain NZE10 / CBS 128990) TaxID=675120 RepID=N1PPI7_DOTSN|nr:hypothetical protein DOTSEDRAFT_70793 [Dothistroma septosporum NZE10]
MDDFAAFTSQEGLYGFGSGYFTAQQQPQPQPQQAIQQDRQNQPHHDPRSHSYPPSIQTPRILPPVAWSSLPFSAMDHEALAQQQQQQQQQSQQQQQHPQQHHYHHHHHHQPQASQSYMSVHSSEQQQLPQQQQQQQQHHAHPSSNHDGKHINLQTTRLDLEYANMLPSDWQYQLQHAAQQQQQQQYGGAQDSNAFDVNAFNTASFGAQLQSSPIDFMPVTTAGGYSVSTGMESTNYMTMAGPMESMNALVYPLNDYQNDVMFPINMNYGRNNESVHSSVHSDSPTATILEVQSLSDNEGSWSLVNFNPQRQSLESTVSNPSQNLHIRTHSDSSSSDGPHSAELSGSYEEIAPWPITSPHELTGQDYLDAQYYQHTHGLPVTSQQYHTSSVSSLAVSPTAAPSHGYRSSGSSTTSPSSSGPTSPPLRRRKTPLDSTGKTTKAVIKKVSPQARREAASEKKVGRRTGPLRPEQRQQAHEIRKLRACLRCKFLKKTCDKGEPCGGCRPSHARLWQVPCTRMDIKDIAYFMKDWKADYERHVSLGFSVNNIKGFSQHERVLYITHGYGHYLPINAREVFVRDDQCFGIDWVETTRSESPEEFEVNTAKLSAGMEGVSTTLLSEYLDRHLDTGFESFVDDYFEGTKFLTDILKTAYRYYQKERTPSVRKALKLVLAYNLTLHVTMVEGLSEEEQFQGRIFDDKSKFHGKTMAPVIINFQIKCALAEMWRELQKDILEELSSLYSSVYSGEKLKNWPTIFMLAAILLAIWEEMQFDCHYRIPDEEAVKKFCDDMETTPVGVIIGLFQAISTKLPGLQEWDTKKHSHLLNNNLAVCDALTEVRGHINKHEKYLRERQSAKFDRDDFDCLSNKFLSKLVIRAN